MNKSEVELFPAAETERYRTEWRAVQAGFVDDPEAAVRAADKLVERAIDTVTSQLAQRREELTSSNGKGTGEGKGEGNGEGQRTEQLRVALRRYRSLFAQLTGLTAADNGSQKPTTNPPRTPAPTSDDRPVTPPPTANDTANDRPVRRPTDGEKDVTPTTDDPQRGVPPMRSRGAKRADSSRPAVDGGDELVEHRADLPDTEG
ncbi:MAG TPA: hypothetical protein VH333_23510 [Pseudonocardiaceae bacterium]|jgi:hypothetical protein|nr:hypothetical protein [Pseudonocardiaceae bacterium]